MIILVAVEIVCYLTTALFCLKIYVAVRNQIHVLQNSYHRIIEQIWEMLKGREKLQLVHSTRMLCF